MTNAHLENDTCELQKHRKCRRCEVFGSTRAPSIYICARRDIPGHNKMGPLSAGRYKKKKIKSTCTNKMYKNSTLKCSTPNAGICPISNQRIKLYSGAGRRRCRMCSGNRRPGCTFCAPARIPNRSHPFLLVTFSMRPNCVATANIQIVQDILYLCTRCGCVKLAFCTHEHRHRSSNHNCVTLKDPHIP